MAEGGGKDQTTGARSDTPVIFISYASADRAAADSICAELERGGIACWIAPRNVTPGAFYADAIVQAINSAHILVVVLSVNSVGSQHVLREVERASAKRRPLVAFRLDTTPLPTGLEYFLSASHWLDASGGTIERALPELVAAVHRLLGVREKSTAGTGLRSDSNINASGSVTAIHGSTPKSRRKRIWVATVAAVLLLAILVGKLWLSNRSALQDATAPVATVIPATVPAAPTIPEKSIAVLPFTDMSEKKDQEFFADGMAEEIINLLAKAPGLHVPARTSSFYFKGKSSKIPEIAHELSVAHVLEGSVRRSGNQLRVTAQLVRADNGYHLWSETYDRDLHDVFKVQDEIANAVAQALQIGLMGGPLTRQEGGTQNLEAYQLFLRATSAELQNTKPSLASADGYLERAIKLDPRFGLAWAAKGHVAMNQTDLGMRPPTEGFERARQFALHAIELSPELAEPHNVLAYEHLTGEWDWAGADAEVRTALRLDPGSVTALEIAAILSYTLGRWDESLRQIHAALDRDPLDTFLYLNLGTVLYMSGQFSAAEAALRKLIEIEANFEGAHAYLAKILLAEGKPAAALIEAQQEPYEDSRLGFLPIALEAVGRKTESDDALKVLITKYANTDALFVAVTYAYRNQPDLALQWLDRAYAQKDSALVEIAGEHLFKNLANEPRYKAFLRKMNLPE